MVGLSAFIFAFHEMVNDSSTNSLFTQYHVSYGVLMYSFWFMHSAVMKTLQCI